MAIGHFQQLQSVTHRLTKLSAAPSLIISDAESIGRVSITKDTLCKLLSAFNESLRLVGILNDHSTRTGVFTSIMDQLRGIIYLTESFRNDIVAVVDELSSTSLPVFLKSMLIQCDTAHADVLLI